LEDHKRDTERNDEMQPPTDHSNACGCLTLPETNRDRAINVLEEVRAECPALHSVFLPGDIWPDFKTQQQQLDRDAGHRSRLLLALEWGRLSRLTGSIHRYLIENGRLRSNVRQQYVRDLREKWMCYQDPLERHRKSKMFIGKVTELQCAEWMETLGWTIVDLEALREGPDIEATRTDSNVVTAFEVKSIGVDDEDFEIMMRSIVDGPLGGPICLYSPINYLLFRIYEAAKQLERFARPRIAIIVIDDSTWWRFQMQLDRGWLDLINPSFFDCHHHPKWEDL
jgi:hypothetical protein